MSIRIKRILFCLVGFLSAFISWPLTELVLFNQGHFHSYLIFSIIQGAMFGLIPGSMFGAIDGLLSKNKYKLLSGIFIGGGLGILGGSVGGIISQKILFILQDMENSILISRTVGIGLLGIFIGISDGVRSLSVKKTIIGVAGGFIGGLLGGFTYQYLNQIYPNLIIARLIGVVFFTTLIGLFYSLIESKLSKGLLYVLNGKLKSREFNIGQKVIKVGKSLKCDIVLDGYEGIDDIHLILTSNKGDMIVKKYSNDSLAYINEENFTEHKLKYEDVIQLGSAKLYFRTK